MEGAIDGQPAVHGESAARVMISNLGRSELGEGIADELEEGVFEKFAEVFRLLLAAKLGGLPGFVAHAELRAAVGVRGIEQERFRWELVRFAEPLFQGSAQRARDADQIECDEDEALSMASLSASALANKSSAVPSAGLLRRTPPSTSAPSA